MKSSQGRTRWPKGLKAISKASMQSLGLGQANQRSADDVAAIAAALLQPDSEAAG
jgi:hypothetical protein